jgi:WD40 repeat protein
VGSAAAGLLALVLVGARFFSRPEAPPSPSGGRPVFVLGGERGRLWAAGLCVAYSSNGKLAASAGEEEVVRVWDAATLREKFTLKGHKGRVFCLAFAPDSRHLISGGQDQVVRLWDLDRPAREAQPLVQQANPSAVSSVCFSADGSRALSGHFNGSVHWWDIKTGQEVGTMGAGTKTVLNVALSADGDQAFALAEPKEFALLNLKAATIVKTFKADGTTRALALSRQGERIAVAADNNVLVWDLKAREQTRTLKGHTGEIYCVALSRDGRVAVSGSLDKTVRLWDTESGECLNVFEGHAGPVRGVALSPDDERLASTGDDRTIRLWDLKQKKAIYPLEGHSYGVQAVAFAPGGRLLASCGGDSRVLIWDLDTRSVCYAFISETAAMPCVAFLGAGKRAFYSANGGKIPVVDAESGGRVTTLPVTSNYSVESIVPVPGHKQFVSCIRQQYAALVNAENGQASHGFAQHFKTARCAAVSPDGELVVTGGDDWNVLLSETATGKLVHRYAGHTDAVLSVGFTPDGRHIISVGADKVVWRWDRPPGRKRTRILTIPEQSDVKADAPPSPLIATAFAPDGRFLASACEGEGRVILWDLEQAKKAAEWKIAGKVNQLAFAADSRRLAAANDNGTVSIYPVPDGPD